MLKKLSTSIEQVLTEFQLPVTWLTSLFTSHVINAPSHILIEIEGPEPSSSEWLGREALERVLSLLVILTSTRNP